jgi:hypothetical protein
MNSIKMQTEKENIVSMPRFEPGSLGQTADTLANSATQWP